MEEYHQQSSLHFLPLLLTVVYYIIRLSVVPSAAGKWITFFLLIWQPAVTVVAYCFKFMEVNCPLWERNRFLILFYWTNLITYYLESLFIWFAFTLDLAHEVAPVIEKELPDASSIKVVLVYLLAARVAFGSKLVSFFEHQVCSGVEEAIAGLGTQTDAGERDDGHTIGVEEPVAGTSSTSTGAEGRDEGTSSTLTATMGRDKGLSSTSTGTEGRDEGTSSTSTGTEGRDEGTSSTLIGTEGRDEGTSSTSTGTEGRDEGTSSTLTGTEGRDEGTSSTLTGTEGRD